MQHTIEWITALLIALSFILLFVTPVQRKYKPSRHAKKPTYEELLKDPRWKAKAGRIKARDGHKCVMCGSTKDLQVHHKYYSRYPNGQKVNPWNYPDEALITVCDECHKKIHSSRRIKLYYRKYTDNYE